jgi:hypothetical protein
MVDLITVAVLIAGFGLGYVIDEMSLRRNKGAFNFIQQCIRKKKMGAFLETDKGSYFTPIEKIYKNIGITTARELIILPRSAVKPCLNMGGIPLVHGDLYKSVVTPQEFRLFVEKMTKEENWTSEEIAKFMEEIESTPPEQLNHRYKMLSKAGELLSKKKGKFDAYTGNKANPGTNPETNLETDLKEKATTDPVALWALQYKDNPKEFKKWNIYINLPTTIKDFIYTGLNRVSIHAMLRELVYQRDLEKMGQRNWLQIAIAFIIIAVGVGFAIRFIFSTPGLLNTLTALAQPASQIAPTP